MSQIEQNAASEQGWEEWPTVGDFMAHVGQTVEVQRVADQCVIIRGRVVKTTDLVGGPAILQYGNYGHDTSGNSVNLALAPPAVKNPYRPIKDESLQRQRIAAYQQAYRDWAKEFRFRIIA